MALVLLLLAEAGVGTLLFGRTLAGHFALYREPSYALGLAAQAGFAPMPLLRLRGSPASPPLTLPCGGRRAAAPVSFVSPR